ncbi:uncharacterized protein (DUF2147 family) [Pedobacter sp. UYP24]
MKKTAVLMLLMMWSSFLFAQKADAVLGKWVNSTDEAHIDITKRGEKYFGKIVWLKDPKDGKGNIKTDYQNPNTSLRSKPIIGLEIIKNFVYEDGKWTDGNIYDPKSGKTYSCNMSIKSNGDLNLRGYIGISIIGRTEIWKRVK